MVVHKVNFGIFDILDLLGCCLCMEPFIGLLFIECYFNIRV